MFWSLIISVLIIAIAYVHVEMYRMRLYKDVHDEHHGVKKKSPYKVARYYSERHSKWAYVIANKANGTIYTSNNTFKLFDTIPEALEEMNDWERMNGYSVTESLE